MKKYLFVFAVSSLLIVSCKKKDGAEPEPEPISMPAKTFEKITFNPTAAYFSTDGSMTAAVDSTTAKTITGKIDITFLFDYSYTQPGFFDPVTRSKVWVWNDYYKKWLSTGVATQYYSTTLTKADFDAAKSDESKIASYFSAGTFILAPHSIFPTGSCIGGRQSSGPSSLLLAQGNVFGFKNTVSGKRGLLYIRTDQYSGWPAPITSPNTKVDIIREN